MPLTLQGMSGSAPTGGTTATVYTCPASTKAIIKSITIRNGAGTSEIGVNLRSKAIVWGNLWTNESITLSEVHILEPGEVLGIFGSSSGDGATYDIAIVEET